MGAAPSTLLPAIDRHLLHEVVRQHVRSCRRWSDEVQQPGPGEQAYTVLTLCRAAEALATGSQLSELAAARAGTARFPEWTALIDWAREWWYDAGSDLDHGWAEEVRRFVEEVSERLLRDDADLPGASRDAPEPTL